MWPLNKKEAQIIKRNIPETKCVRCMYSKQKQQQDIENYKQKCMN